jgi:hypothetical protein
MQQQRDQNIMSAWEKGGNFEGKPVTDERVLAHWRERMEGVSPDDPMYDTFKNAVTQYEYAIAESKASTAYAQGRMSDGQMAAFYLGWAKKVPKNSEFYRVLQRDAAQFTRAARSRSDAFARQRKEQAYQDKLAALHRNERQGEFLIDVLTSMAQQGSRGIAGLIAGPGSNSDLTQFDSGDPEQMTRLLQMITPFTLGSGESGLERSARARQEATDQVLFNQADGTPVTGRDIVDRLTKLDGSFNGTVDLAYVRSALLTQRQQVQKRIDLANETGHVTDANSFTKQRDYLDTLGRQVNAWPVQVDYMNAREAYLEVFNSDQVLPDAKVKAWQAYQAKLMTLSEDPRIANDATTKNALYNEAQQVEGTVTLAESFTQMVSKDSDFKGEVSKNAELLAAWDEQAVQLKNDPHNYQVTTGEYNADGSFTPTAGGPSLGVARMEDIHAVAASIQGDPRIVYAPTASGTPQAVMVVGVPVRVYATDPTTGQAMAKDNDLPVANVYQVNVGGQVVEVFGYTGIDGRQVFSSEPPWDPEATGGLIRGERGMVLDLSKYVAQGNVPGVTIRRATRSPGQGRPYLDPAAVIDGTDPTRAATRGKNPATEFFSPTLAAVFSLPEGARLLDTLKNDPLFRAQIEREAAEASGITIDQKTGAPVGDPKSIEQFTQYRGQVEAAQAALDFRASPERHFAAMAKAWRKDVESLVGIVRQAEKAGADVSGWYDRGWRANLELDRLDGTQMAALGRATVPGSNLLTRFAGTETDERVTLRLQGSLKLPAAPPPTPAAAPPPGATPGADVKPYQAPPPPSSTPPTSTPSPTPQWKWDRLM